MNRVFVYDDLLIEKKRELLKLAPINEQIAETTGKLYYIHRNPIMLRIDDIAHNRGQRKVFGAILTFQDEQMEKVLHTLDNYKGCSLSRIGRSHPYDLCVRSTLEVYPINANNIHDIQNFTYKFFKPVRCIVYLGNPQHEKIIYNVKIDRHHKIDDGCYKKGFVNLLKRGGYFE